MWDPVFLSIVGVTEAESPPNLLVWSAKKVLFWDHSFNIHFWNIMYYTMPVSFCSQLLLILVDSESLGLYVEFSWPQRQKEEGGFPPCPAHAQYVEKHGAWWFYLNYSIHDIRNCPLTNSSKLGQP